jgi:hypothetical protein
MFFFGLLLLLHPTTNILDRKENLKKFRIGSELIRRKKPEETKYHKNFWTKPNQAAPNRINPKSSINLNRPSTTIENKHPQKICYNLTIF